MSPTKKARERKKWEKCQRMHARMKRAWAPYALLISEAPLEQAVKRALEKNKARVLKYRVPRPEVRLDPSATRYSEAEQVRAEVESVFEKYWVDRSDGILAADFVMAGFALTRCSFLSRLDGVSQPTWWAARPALRASMRTLAEEVWLELMVTAYLFTMAHARFDQRLWWWSVDSETQKDKRPMIITLHAPSAQSRTVTLDGKSRRVYRCASWSTRQSLTWTSWNTSEAGLDGEPAACDVYVQGHAFDRLRERIPIGMDFALHEAMVQSLSRPVFTKSDSGQCLVEYRVMGQRLGYFVATRLGEIIVVRSFLFLTMQGTPEARRLREQLGLRRPDVEYLGWDNPQTFVLSKLQNDPVLLQILNQCGCGHLPNALEREYFDPTKTLSAKSAREYLGLAEHR